MSAIEIKTSELHGVALDWAVFCARYPGIQPTICVQDAREYQAREGAAPILFPRSVTLTYQGAYGSLNHWSPSTDWSVCGPMIHASAIELSPGDGWQSDGGGCWGALMITDRAEASCSFVTADGETPQIAACRAFVAAKLGDTVSVPSELLS